MKIEPYLCFNGQCEQAIEFYRQALDAEVPLMMRFKDSPEPHNCADVDPELIMHANVQIGGNTLMMSDGNGKGGPEFRGFSLTIAPADRAEAERLFNALADGGTIEMPLSETFWATCFGMVTDRFGVSWMINLEG
ncbi:VOC family protein [Marinobacterium arenosum]|uniref:VOC family protein n=1 Tax=Marinobacterium arenosum TaxID=2862496 RepID=UPI001C968D69|nr:VOC family protein [Marinobacterium arenosum]MBY4675374.1 VOC family protein [Marinobacterium arenosum]